MVVEAVRVLNGSTLDTLNSVLLFVGLGLLAVGGVVLVMAVVAVDDVAAVGAEHRQRDGSVAVDEGAEPGADSATAEETASPAS
jgi:hypothetical protein